MLGFFFFLLLSSAIAFGHNVVHNRRKIFNEGDHLLPEFNIQTLEVAEEYMRQNPECPDVMEKVTVYR